MTNIITILLSLLTAFQYESLCSSLAIGESVSDTREVSLDWRDKCHQNADVLQSSSTGLSVGDWTGEEDGGNTGF